MSPKDPVLTAEQIGIVRLTNGKYKFSFRHSGLARDIPGGSSADNIPLEQAPDNSTLNRQQFPLERTY